MAKWVDISITVYYLLTHFIFGGTCVIWLTPMTLLVMWWCSLRLLENCWGMMKRFFHHYSWLAPYESSVGDPNCCIRQRKKVIDVHQVWPPTCTLIYHRGFGQFVNLRYVFTYAVVKTLIKWESSTPKLLPLGGTGQIPVSLQDAILALSNLETRMRKGLEMLTLVMIFWCCAGLASITTMQTFARHETLFASYYQNLHSWHLPVLQY